MKKIMILGGGYYQLPLINVAKKCNIETIVCGIAGNYPGYKVADKWIDVDTFDKEACLLIAQKESIDGILTTGTDQMLPTLGYIVDRLHLLGPSEMSTKLSTNKFEMKKAFFAKNVRTASFQRVVSVDDCLSFSNKFGYPVVLKVVDASGSRGVVVVHSEEELFVQFPLIFDETKLDYIIIEKFISGEEFGAQAFVRNGKLTFVMPHGDVVFHGLTDVPIGHYAPYERSEELMEDIRSQLELCVDALGIDNTAINADFILSDGKVYVLEIGARAGATCLPELISCHYDMNYYEYLIRMCLGEAISFPTNPKCAGYVETLQTQLTGEVLSIATPQLPTEVHSFCIYPKKGDLIRSFRNAYDRIGTLVLKGNNVEELRCVRDSILNNLDIKIKDL